MKTRTQRNRLAWVGLGLLFGASMGCQTNIAGMTLPSAHYLKHPPQYIAPSPAFPLQRELASMEQRYGAAATTGAAAPATPAPAAGGAQGQ